MSKVDKIIKWFSDNSKGVVKLSPEQAQQVIDIAQEEEPTAVAKKYRWNYNNHLWDFIRDIPTDDDTLGFAAALIDKKIEPAPDRRSFKYELMASTGESVGCLYTSDNNLFEN